MSDGIDIFDPSPRQRIIWRIAQAGALYWCVKTTLRQTLRPGLGDEVEWRGQRWILMNGIYPDSWKAKPKGGEHGDGLVPRDEVAMPYGEGYAASFLEEAFGGLARKHGGEAVERTLRFKSDDEPTWKEEAEQAIVAMRLIPGSGGAS